MKNTTFNKKFFSRSSIAIALYTGLAIQASADVITDWNLIAVKAAKKGGQNNNYKTHPLVYDYR